MRKQSENAFIDTLSFVSCLAKNARRNGAGEKPIVACPIFGSRLETTPTALGTIDKISSPAKKKIAGDLVHMTKEPKTLGLEVTSAPNNDIMRNVDRNIDIPFSIAP